VVREEVLAAVVRRDEPEALRVVEPLHFACRHVGQILDKKTSIETVRAPHAGTMIKGGNLTATTGAALGGEEGKVYSLLA
jgi:hypothetical protein